VKQDKLAYAQTQFAAAISHHRAGRIDQAAAAYREGLRHAPRHADALHLLGVIEAQRGRLDEALPLLRQAAQLSPNSAEISLNLANALLTAGQGNPALDAYRTAVKLRPGFRAARDGLLAALGRIATFLESENRGGDTIPLWREAIALSPDSEAHWLGLARALEVVAFVKRDPQLHDVLYQAMSHPAINPNTICHAVLSYVRLTPGFEAAMREAAPPAAIPSGHLFTRVIDSGLMADPEVERTLTRWRAAALRGATADLPLLCAIAGQCFMTDYAYAEAPDETRAVAALEQSVGAALAADGAVEPAQLALLAAYRPLHRIPGAAALAAGSLPPPLDRLVRRQVIEPLEEATLRESIPTLTPIHDDVSRAVRGQYEESPYPRWSNVARQRPAAGVTETIGTTNPDMLIAGCGTGQHSAHTAMRFPAARILAVDLSLASLGFAKRRARELGLANLEFAQADILELGVLDRRFDIVESAGVLHHMHDPLAGWRVLAGLVKPGGLMFIGLYSELARRAIVQCRAFIAARGFPATPQGIRDARQVILAEMDDSVVRRLRTNIDFYSVSGARDLLFHVQEHRFSVLQIAASVEQLGLTFVGFDALDREAMAKYRTRFPDDPHMRSLANMAAFEADNPDTFAGMYKFWVRKPA
jgi:SAM-dependent methyltransferase/tetratricopeptide (TPR) repeat protein